MPAPTICTNVVKDDPSSNSRGCIACNLQNESA